MIFKKGENQMSIVHAMNVGPPMNPVHCTIVILAHLFSQIILSLFFWLQIKIHFKTTCSTLTKNRNTVWQQPDTNRRNQNCIELNIV